MSALNGFILFSTKGYKTPRPLWRLTGNAPPRILKALLAKWQEMMDHQKPEEVRISSSLLYRLLLYGIFALRASEKLWRAFEFLLFVLNPKVRCL